MKKILYSISICFIFFSCEETFIGEDEVNNPINNFEILWDDFDKHYGLFTVRETNWDALYDIYRPQVNTTTTDDELWVVLTNLLEELDDSHTSIHNGTESFSSGSSLDAQSAEEFSNDIIEREYLEYYTTLENYSGFGYGKVRDKNIGYIYFGVMEGDNPEVIDEIMNELRDFDALLFDIRQNTGGDDSFAANIAKAFSDGEHLIYSKQTRNGSNHNDFDEKTYFSTSFDANNSYTKPVIVLTDIVTVSAAEIFLLHMNAFEHVTQIGTETAGDFSDVSSARFLPNGWIYFYSGQKYLLPNGKSLDGIGHIPDIYVKNTITNIENNEDVVLEKAFEYLLNTHQID